MKRVEMIVRRTKIVDKVKDGYSLRRELRDFHRRQMNAIDAICFWCAIIGSITIMVMR